MPRSWAPLLVLLLTAGNLTASATWHPPQPIILPLFRSSLNLTRRSPDRHLSTAHNRTSNARMRLHDDLLTNGYYTTRLWIGTPGQEFALIVDSGSTVTYVPCATCEQCGNHQDPRFQPDLSSTYQPVKCNNGCTCNDDNTQCPTSTMYGRRASSLLREFAATEKGQLTAYNSDTFDQVIKECNEHSLQLQSLIRKIEEQNLDIQTTRNEDHFGAVIHHLSITRNKRCLMAYMYNRAEIIQSLRWKIGPVLPQEIQEKLNFSEEEYFKNHSAAIESYMSELDLDLTVDMVPPKDPYIRVKVLDDIGEVCLGDHSISLTQQSLHFLRRTDAEPFISQGLMEEFLE